MQVNVAGLRRNIKNLAHNYSDAQVKVREATSNDPWGPSATIMAEIADLTYNVVAFSEIMQMIWKRLNDHGKNWRHVYKALILLEYLIKTGTEKVAQQCKENIFAIQTLREFVYMEEGKDQGTHVREKAKQLVNLLKDDERLKNERVKALKAKERFASHPSGFGSDGYIDGPSQRDMPPGWQEEPPKSVSELEMVRPQTAGEEELQLQLAMAMSREEAEQEEAKRRSDDVRLRLALSQSEQDFKDQNVRPGAIGGPKRDDQQHQQQQQQSHLLDLLDISLGATSISSPPLGAAGGAMGGGGGGVVVDPWNAPTSRAASQLSDPWSGTSSPQIDPWHPSAGPRGGAMGAPTMGLGGGVVAALGAAGTNGSSDAWALRTQSPSVASGSSTEGWLQTNGNATNGIGSSAAAPSGAPNSVTDPWLTKSNATPVMGAVPPTTGAISRGASADAWLVDGAAAAKPDDPWAPKAHAEAAGGGGIEDPWRSIEQAGVKKLSPDMDEFDIITNRTKTGELISTRTTTTNFNASNNNNNASLLDEMDPLSSHYGVNHSTGATSKKPLKDPQSFLGENSALVNLDNLIKPIAPQTQTQPGGAAAYNPFSDTVIPPKTNLFQQQQPAVPSINQLKQQAPFAVTMNQDPWAPVGNNATNMTSQLAKDFAINNYESSQNECRNLYPAIIQTPPRPTSLNLRQMNTFNNASNFHDVDHQQQQQQQQQFITNNNNNDNINNKPPLTHSRSLFFNYNPNVERLRNMDIEPPIVVGEPSVMKRSFLPLPISPTMQDIQQAPPMPLPLHVPMPIANNTHNDNNNAINNNNNDTPFTPTYTNFAQNYSNALSASLASTPGVVIKPLMSAQDLPVGFNGSVGSGVGLGSMIAPTPVAMPMPASSFAGGFTAASAAAGNANMLSYCSLENNNNNNNNMPWNQTEAAATNPFLS